MVPTVLATDGAGVSEVGTGVVVTVMCGTKGSGMGVNGLVPSGPPWGNCEPPLVPVLAEPAASEVYGKGSATGAGPVAVVGSPSHDLVVGGG